MPIDSAKLKEKFDKKSAERADRFTMKDKDNYLRLLPPSVEYLGDNVDYIALEFLIHFGIGSEEEKTAETCPKTLGKGHKCPICEAVFKLYKTNTAEDKALASRIRAKKRYIFNILDLNDLEKGIQILEVGPKVYDQIVVFVTNPKWGDLLDLDKGRNIVITRTPGKETTSGYNEYSVTPDPDITSIRSKLSKEFKENISLLKKQLPTPKTYEELKILLEGGDVVESSSTVVSTPIKEKETTPSATVVVSTIVEKESKEVKKKEEEKQPTCFSVEYGPRREECTVCVYKVECREKFLEV